MKTPHNRVLSLEARDAIRGYILWLVALPVVALAVFMFLLGFFINEAARG